MALSPDFIARCFQRGALQGGSDDIGATSAFTANRSQLSRLLQTRFGSRRSG